MFHFIAQLQVIFFSPAPGWWCSFRIELANRKQCPAASVTDSQNYQEALLWIHTADLVQEGTSGGGIVACCNTVAKAPWWQSCLCTEHWSHTQWLCDCEAQQVIQGGWSVGGTRSYEGFPRKTQAVWWRLFTGTNSLSWAESWSSRKDCRLP